MKRREFLELIDRFALNPIPATLNRHIYIWLGEVAELTAMCPPGFLHKLDIHELCKDLEKTPMGDKAASRVLTDAIEDWLLINFSNATHQQSLLVIGLDLLYRYRIPLSLFIQLSNERNMVILGLSILDIKYKPLTPLPSYVQFSPYSILKYATSEIPEEAIVKED